MPHGIGDKTPVVCVACGSEVDRLRDPARVESGRVVHMCRACAGVGGESASKARARALSQSACARCGSQVPLYEARPVHGADGRIALACVACAEGRPEDPGPEIPGDLTAALAGAPVPAFSYLRRHAAALAALAVAVLLAVLQVRAQTPPRSAAADSLHVTAASLPGGLLAWPGASSATAGDGQVVADGTEPREDDSAGESAGAHGDHVLGEDQDDWLADIDTGVLDDGGELPPTIEDMRERSEPLEERLPTLADWVFPVLGSEEPFPLKPTRQFGADRDGRGSRECGRGHCGVDLDGPRGTPVAAVAWGVVTRVERRGHQSSGKYVGIQHPDFVYTAYMHLDDIREDLQVGDEVNAGDVIGTLGRTGIRHSAPHLHFGLAVPSGSRLVYIDPAPYLERAERTRAR